MVSNASDDLPEPDRPVNTISWSRGSTRSTLRRLCSRAPRIRIVLLDESATGPMVPKRRPDRTDVRRPWSGARALQTDHVGHPVGPPPGVAVGPGRARAVPGEGELERLGREQP